MVFFAMQSASPTPTPQPLSFLQTLELELVRDLVKAVLIYMLMRDFIGIVVPFVASLIVSWIERSLAAGRDAALSFAEEVAEAAGDVVEAAGDVVEEVEKKGVRGTIDGLVGTRFE
jgi:hypothetical protein